MKRILFLVICLFPILGFAQNAPTKKKKKVKTVEAQTDKDVYTVVNQMPEFPGGKDAMFEYVFANMRFPDEAREKGIDGLVVVRFIVDEEGNISNIKVRKSVSPALDKEAMRVVNSMPKWKPGKNKGKLVKVYMDLPVKFKL